MNDHDDDTPTIYACPQCAGPLREEPQRYGTGWHDCPGCGWRETLPTDLEAYTTPPENACLQLAVILEDLDSPDLVEAEEASGSLEDWLARWLPTGTGTSWDPILTPDQSATVGVEFYSPHVGTVRLVVRTVAA